MQINLRPFHDTMVEVHCCMLRENTLYKLRTTLQKLLLSAVFRNLSFDAPWLYFFFLKLLMMYSVLFEAYFINLKNLLVVYYGLEALFSFYCIIASQMNLRFSKTCSRQGPSIMYVRSNLVIFRNPLPLVCFLNSRMES